MVRKSLHYEKPDYDLVRSLASELSIAPLVAGLLINRGIKTVEESELFLQPSFNDLHDPFLFRDMGKAVSRIKKAISNDNTFANYPGIS